MHFLAHLSLILYLQISLCHQHRKHRIRHRRTMKDEEHDAYGRYVPSKYRSKADYRSEHPERRVARRDPDDDISEFVRTEWKDTVYNKIRTYTSAPHQIECYSCMSLSYQTSWKYLQKTYIYPKVFTDRCRDPGNERGMPTVACTSVCVSLLEPDIEAGVFIGYKYIRGCMDRVLRHGFNESAIRTHRFQQHNQCRTLSRGHLFNPARISDPPAIGDVQLCSCYEDRCNGSNQSISINIWNVILLILVFSLR